MNPKNVAQARTARLAREGQAPAWSTKTGDRPVWQVQQDVKRTLPRPEPEWDCCEDCG